MFKEKNQFSKLDYETMDKTQALEHLKTLNDMCVLMEQNNIEYTLDQIIEIKTRQAKLESILKGEKVKNDD
jgi:hypothetical protein